MKCQQNIGHYGKYNKKHVRADGSIRAIVTTYSIPFSSCQLHHLKQNALKHLPPELWVCRFLLDNVDKMPDISKKTVKELGMAFKPLFSVPPEKSAIEALKIMAENMIGALAVINKAGQIVGNFSATEMRYSPYLQQHLHPKDRHTLCRCS